MPLVASWTLANKPGKPKAWIEPIIDRNAQTISYEIREGGEPSRERTCSGSGATCLATDAAISLDYIRAEAQAGRMGVQLMAVVAQGERGRVYCAPEHGHHQASLCEEPEWKPALPLPPMARSISVQLYGFDEWWKLFTTRQLVALTTFSDLLGEVADCVVADALAAGMAGDGVRLRDDGRGAHAYADAVVTYLALGISRLTDMCNAFCMWESSRTQVRHLFTRQGISMMWDFAENNVFNDAGGDFRTSLGSVIRALERLPATGIGRVAQRDARARVRESSGAVISTDPPYYDNVTYSESSDFFYVWLRRNLSEVWPEECGTLLTPKSQELVANRYQHGSKKAAEHHFRSGMAEFMAQVAEKQPDDIPATVYYAYKAKETQEGEIRVTGWDTFLQAVVDAGLQVNATWPMRTELSNRLVASGTNALASSIVLACRPRHESAAPATRGEFIAALRQELPEAVRLLQSGNIRPVDMAQSTIGPGIKVFSRYSQVVEADGSSMPVSGCAGDHQRRAGRGARRCRGRPRRRHPFRSHMVCRVRLRPGSLRRRRQRGPGQELPRWLASMPPVSARPVRASSGCMSAASLPPIGPRPRTAGRRCGRPPSTWQPRCCGRSRRRPRCCTPSAVTATGPASLPTCCIRQPTTGAGYLRRVLMTLSSLLGRACVSASLLSPPRSLLRRVAQPSRCCYDRAGPWCHTV